MISAESKVFLKLAEVLFSGELSFSHVDSCSCFVEMTSSSPTVPSFFSPFLQNSPVLGLFFRILKGLVLPGAVSLFFEGDLQAIVSCLLGLLDQGEHHHLHIFLTKLSSSFL